MRPVFKVLSCLSLCGVALFPHPHRCHCARVSPRCSFWAVSALCAPGRRLLEQCVCVCFLERFSFVSATRPMEPEHPSTSSSKPSDDNSVDVSEFDGSVRSLNELKRYFPVLTSEHIEFRSLLPLSRTCTRLSRGHCHLSDLVCFTALAKVHRLSSTRVRLVRSLTVLDQCKAPVVWA